MKAELTGFADGLDVELSKTNQGRLLSLGPRQVGEEDWGRCRDGRDGLGGAELEFCFDRGKFEMPGHPSGEVGGWNLKPKGKVSLEFSYGIHQHLGGISCPGSG